MPNKNQKVLAIDPGFERLGVAIVEKRDNKEILVYSECFKTSADLEFSARLLAIGKKIEEMIATFEPECLAIEKLYFNSNQKTVMHVSEVRGAIIYVAKAAGLDVFEFTPLEIKVAVTGYGKSDKSAVKQMVSRLVTVDKKRKYDDEFDAIAVGLTKLAYRN